METSKAGNTDRTRRIVVIRNGPYTVEGDVPLVMKSQVVSEHGEPLTWQKTGVAAVDDGEYHLCRCGGSSDKPFCDGTHRRVGFDGTETAGIGVTKARATKLPPGTRIIIKKDQSLCMHSGYCGFSDINISKLAPATHDTKLRALVMAMVERCPSGALTFQIDENGPDIEPDLPQQVAVTTEITSDGPISGPLWVTGGISIDRSDGQPFETRNRITLCNCGHSCNKPLCDGTHRDMAQREAKCRQTTS